MTESEISAAELDEFRKQYGIQYSIGDFTPTVCALSGVRVPKQSGGIPSESVLGFASKELNGGKIEKMLLFCPDAIGDVQCKRFPEIFAGVEKLSDVFLPGVSVMQCVTPVCYATIFSGASPSVHGIRTYEKPVLKIETLFDILAEAGKNIKRLSEQLKKSIGE